MGSRCYTAGTAYSPGVSAVLDNPPEAEHTTCAYSSLLPLCKETHLSCVLSAQGLGRIGVSQALLFESDSP